MRDFGGSTYTCGPVRPGLRPATTSGCVGNTGVVAVARGTEIQAFRAKHPHLDCYPMNCSNLLERVQKLTATARPVHSRSPSRVSDLTGVAQAASRR